MPQQQERLSAQEINSILEAGDKYREKGIRFKLAVPGELEKIWEFISDEFLPDEPVMRSLGMNETKTSTQRYVRKSFKKDIIDKKCLKSEGAYSIIALNSNDEVMGVKLGYTVSAGEKKHPFNYMPWLRHLYWALPKSMEEANTAMWFFEEKFRYHPNYALEDLKVKKMFEGEILGVSKKARGLGLGKEMLRMSMALAKEAKCEAYFSGVSGVYSQKIYRDMGFTVFRELLYADVKTKSGKSLLNDTREHTKLQNVCFSFNEQ